MKHWFNILSGWHRIFIILSFGYLIFIICVGYKEFSDDRKGSMESLIAKDRLVEIYELISGCDNEGKSYYKGSKNLSNLFEWLSSEGIAIEASHIAHTPENHISLADLASARPIIVHPDGSHSYGSPMEVIEILKWTTVHDWGSWAEVAVSRYKKDFDFSDIENRYKTKIHNHRRHINVEKPVGFFLLWIVNVALAYGLCLGSRKVIIWATPWLNKLSGWYRIFLVYACTNLIIVVFIWIFMPDIVSSRSLTPKDMIGFIFTYAIMPIVLIYGLGRGVGWAIKGFSKENDK